jgi:hypothetical protein
MQIRSSSAQVIAFIGIRAKKKGSEAVQFVGKRPFQILSCFFDVISPERAE